MALKGEYAFSVGDPTDDSQSTSVLTFTGSPATASGKNGGGLLTDAANFATSPGVATASGLVTVMGWYKLSATTGFAKSLFKSAEWSVYISCFSGSPRILASDWGLTASTLSNALPNDTNWHHWAATFGAGPDVPVVLYVDGVLVNSDTFFTTTALNLTGTFDVGGSDPDGLGGTGTITQDDFRVFNEILNAGTVTTWMNAAGPTVSGPTFGATRTGSTGDRERGYYLSQGGLAGRSLSDLRRASQQQKSDHVFWSEKSGLTPASRYSVADHKRSAMLTLLAEQPQGRSLADIESKFWGTISSAF